MDGVQIDVAGVGGEVQHAMLLKLGAVPIKQDVRSRHFVPTRLKDGCCQNNTDRAVIVQGYGGGTHIHDFCDINGSRRIVASELSKLHRTVPAQQTRQ